MVSIDNDAEVIRHMQDIYGHDDRLSWLTYDILCEDGLSSVKGSVNADQNKSPLLSGSFDIIVDKGTLDAILVEGQICNMLANIYELLSENGVYFVCSLFASDIVANILAIPSLGFQVKQYALTTDQSSCAMTTKGNIFISRKISADHVVDRVQMSLEESTIMNHHFQFENPLLTTEKEIQIIERFRSTSTGYLPLSATYNLLFGEFDMVALGYNMDLFLEDVKDFPLTVDDMMNEDEAIAFIKSKQ